VVGGGRLPAADASPYPGGSTMRDPTEQDAACDLEVLEVSTPRDPAEVEVDAVGGELAEAFSAVMPIGGVLLMECTLHGRLCCDLEQKFGALYGTDFSDVRIFVSHLATHANGQVIVDGTDIHFAPGTYHPHSDTGREALSLALAQIAEGRRHLASSDLAPGLVRTPHRVGGGREEERDRKEDDGRKEEEVRTARIRA